MNDTYVLSVSCPDLDRAITLFNIKPTQRVVLPYRYEQHYVAHPDLDNNHTESMQLTTVQYVRLFDIPDGLRLGIEINLTPEDMLAIKLIDKFWTVGDFINEDLFYEMYNLDNVIMVDNVTKNRITETIRVRKVNEEVDKAAYELVSKYKITPRLCQDHPEFLFVR